jgi:hypothetical protein
MGEVVAGWLADCSSHTENPPRLRQACCFDDLAKASFAMDAADAQLQQLQTGMGLVFGLMGLGTMLLPRTLIPLSLTPAALTGSPLLSSPAVLQHSISPALELTFRCFGSQACLCSLLILTSKFTSSTWKCWGVGMLPFFAFDWLAFSLGWLTPLGAMGDFAGNCVFVACSYQGYHLSLKQEQARR